MLCTLSIRDVVLIDRLDIRFQSGLCVLTGETGSGKSILLDALGLALGQRADARLVRHGAARAVVTAEFEPPAEHSVHALLGELGIGGGGGVLLLRRVVDADGRSRAFINDQPVGVGLLRRVGQALVEVHGQFDNQRLLDAAAHRDILDAFAGLMPAREGVAAARQAWTEATAERAAATLALETARRDEDFLRHGLDEITALAPHAGEEAELAGQRALMINGEKLIGAVSDAMADLEQGSGVEAALGAALRRLARLAETAGGRLDEAMAALERAAAEAAEGRALLERAGAALDVDPRILEAAEERLFALRRLARKHDTDVDGLADVASRMAAALAGVADGGARLERLTGAEAAARDVFQARAGALSAARKEAAARLDGAVAEELAPLRLDKATFVTALEPLDQDKWGDHGQDRVTFRIAANPGSPPGPLNRIASGGELARFMLALKVVLAAVDPVPTMVFDEVDSGVGGAVAAAVGDRLARLAGAQQVLVVTHSPQVAALGSHHWRVSKVDDAPGVLTTVDALGDGARREEIARMLAGARITDEARAAAGSLLLGRGG